MPKNYNYRVQDACPYCEHCIPIWDWESPDTWYCGLNAPKRPPCGSVGMNESFYLKDKGTEGYTFNDWLDWAEDRGVSDQGICDCFKKRV